MNDLQLITATLEQLAELDVDITPQVYARFFASCPAAAALFATTESCNAQGKMLNELVVTVLEQLEKKPYSKTVLETMVCDHDNWGVTLPMYDAFLLAFGDTLEATLGAHAPPAAMVIWRRELTVLREQIRRMLLQVNTL